MKKIFFACLLFSSAFLKGQDSSYCYNSGFVVSQAEAPSVVLADNKGACSLILMPYVMSESEVVWALKEKKNYSIDKLLAKVKFSKNMRLVGLAAIPASAIGAISIAEANKNNASFNVGLGLVALSAVSLSSSLYFNKERKKNYKKAIAKYNQLYN